MLAISMAQVKRSNEVAVHARVKALHGRALNADVTRHAQHPVTRITPLSTVYDIPTRATANMF
jgi:hypothetical protein